MVEVTRISHDPKEGEMGEDLSGPKLQVACVYVRSESGESGGFDAGYVLRLALATRRAISLPHRFLCYTNRKNEILSVYRELERWMYASAGDNFPVPIELVDLGDEKTNPLQVWPGWWSKMNIFSPERPYPGDRTLFLDLDSVVCDSLLAAISLPIQKTDEFNGGLVGLGDFNDQKRFASGVMLLAPEYGEELWNYFTKSDPNVVIRNFRGDQDFIQNFFSGMSESLLVQRLQDFFPGRFVSWKVHCSPQGSSQGKGQPPDGAWIVCFHGTPRPKDAARESVWVHRMWGDLLPAFAERVPR